MTRILLVDDSPHAQRMGERILSDEGYEVVTVSNADSALIRLEDVDPDVVVADAVMPGRTGYDVCQFLKMSPRHRHVKVILTAGVLEPLDEDRVRQVEADSTLKKPFEATALLASVKPLADAAAAARAESGGGVSQAQKPAFQEQAPFIAVVDAEQVRAAVTVALDASMAAMVEEISRRVMAALQTGKPDPERVAALSQPASRGDLGSLSLPHVDELHVAPAASATPAPAQPSSEPVRRVTPLRVRTGSIMGLDLGRTEPETERPARITGSIVPPLPALELPPAPHTAAAPTETFSVLDSLLGPRPADPAEAPVTSTTELPSLPPLVAETDAPSEAAEEAAAPAPARALPDAVKAPPRTSLLRPRPGSILGLDTYVADEEESPPPRS